MAIMFVLMLTTLTMMIALMSVLNRFALGVYLCTGLVVPPRMILKGHRL